MSRTTASSRDRSDLELGLATDSHDRADEARWEELPQRQRGQSEATDATIYKDDDAAITEIEAAPGLKGRLAVVELPWKRSTTSTPSSLTAPSPPERRTDISAWEARILYHIQLRFFRFLDGHPRAAKVFAYVRGPRPAVTETAIRPFLPRIEVFFARTLSPFQRSRHFVIPLFLIAWFLAFTFLVRASYFTSDTSEGAPAFISADDSFWAKNDACGLNGTNCTPNPSLLFRCPAQSQSVKLLNYNPVGPLEVIYEPLVVGGFDDLSTYRADSWICPAAIQHGLFGNSRGGCGKVVQVGEFTGFVGGARNGIKSVSFDTTFISSYRFEEGVSQADCADIRNEILGFNVAMSTLFSFVVRPAASIFYWVLFCMGYWHVVLVSDSRSTPPDVATGFQFFLPALFIGYAFWRFSWRYVVSAFDTAVLEKTVWYLGGFWVGVLINVTTAWIPIDRLTPHDINQQPGGLVAVICLAVFLFLVIVNQLRVIRRTGWLFFYVGWYVVGAIIIGLLLTLPLEFRLHHYFAAMLLMPGCAFVTRPSALFQGFLLGMFLDGAGRWGFDSILQTAASLIGDGALGSALPSFNTSSTNFAVGQTLINWNPIPLDLVGQWDSFGLIVDDVLEYTGNATSYSLKDLDANLPHYFRLGYVLSGSFGDFTRAATAVIANGTWIDPVAGPS